MAHGNNLLLQYYMEQLVLNIIMLAIKWVMLGTANDLLLVWVLKAKEDLSMESGFCGTHMKYLESEYPESSLRG